MITILPLEKCDATLIVEWNKEQNANFLEQWAGRGYQFPITETQILNRIDAEQTENFIIYKILLDDEMIGTIELISIDEKSSKVNIGRFLLNPLLTGKGYGTVALKEFVSKTFKEFRVERIELSVFDFNISAYRCYEKVGFKVTRKETRPNGLIAIYMEAQNPTL